MAHVTIPATDPFIAYTGDGVTQGFPFPFPFFDAEDISVYVDGVEQIGGYAVAGDPLDGGFEDGTVTFTTAPHAAASIFLVRRLDIKRVTDFPYPSQVLDIQSVNTELDRIVAMMQGLGLDSRRALRVPVTEITVDELPGIKNRANKVLVFDGNGQPQALTFGSGDLDQAAVELLVNTVLGQLFPPGLIMLWAGSTGTIPKGWALCNGANGTPDLRNRFVVGAGQTYGVYATGGATSVTSGGGGAHNHGGATGDHTLTTDEIPSHFHSLGTVTVRNRGTGGLIDGSGAYSDGAANTEATGAGLGHGHTISTQTDHTHTVATVPPYYALAYIMRTGFFVPATDGGTGAALTDAALSGVLQFACGDETTAIGAPATGLIKLRSPFALATISGVRASLNRACTTGTFEVDIKVGGVSILSTHLTIDATEKTSTTAVVPAVLATTALADDAEITVDVVDEGDGTATGMKIAIIGLRPAA